MQKQSQKFMKHTIFLIFFLLSFLSFTFAYQISAHADEILQSTARILSPSTNSRILSTVPQGGAHLGHMQNHGNGHLSSQEQGTFSNSEQNIQQYGQNPSDSASAGFYFNLYNPYGPSISAGAFANGTSSQNTPMRRSKSQIIRVDQNNIPLYNLGDFDAHQKLPNREENNVAKSDDKKIDTEWERTTVSNQEFMTEEKTENILNSDKKSPEVSIPFSYEERYE